MQTLDQSQPVSGAKLIALSEHVDYWNDIGWKDPYSSHDYSERQSAYAGRLGLASVYTPQMVVDGRFEFVGSDERRATQVIRDASRLSKAPVSISFHSDDDKTATLHVEAGPLPSLIATRSAGVFLAVADNSDESEVSRGENAGRTLRHVAVLRNLIPIGAVDGSTMFSRDIKVGLDPKSPKNVRLMVIVQETGVGRVVGAGLARLPADSRP